jgi:hypothetical protein
VVILPLSTIDELSSLPTSVATPNGALEHDLLGSYTNLNLILESRLHHLIVQRKLTPRLAMLTPGLQNELTATFDDYFPACGDEWMEIQPFRLLGKVVARLSARAMVGPSICRDPIWLDISVNYPEHSESCIPNNKQTHAPGMIELISFDQCSGPSFSYGCSPVGRIRF